MLDVNGDHETSAVARHAAAEVSPPIQNASPRLVPLHWLGAHVVVSLGMHVQSGSSLARLHPRGHVGVPKRAGYCLAGIGDSVLELEIPSDPTHRSDDVPKHCCGGVNE